MSNQANIEECHDLIRKGEELAPLGGYEFSGYNARLQDSYGAWRKKCIEWIESAGPVGFPYKNKILADQNCAYYYQASVLSILSYLLELLKKWNDNPALFSATEPTKDKEEPVIDTVSAEMNGKVKIIRPPPAKKEVVTGTTQPSKIPKKSNSIYLVIDQGSTLAEGATDLLHELGLQGILVEREKGKINNLSTFGANKDVQGAIFVIDSAEYSHVLYEIGHFTAKLGEGHVFIIHKSDISFPKDIPGAIIKSVREDFDEIGLSLLKDLKACGYEIAL